MSYSDHDVKRVKENVSFEPTMSTLGVGGTVRH